MGQAAYDMTEVRRRRAPQTQRNVPLRVEKGGKPRLNPVRPFLFLEDGSCMLV